MNRPAAMTAAALALAGCGEPSVPTGIVLTATGTETSPDGRMCAVDVTARNATDRDATNIQVAYTATTSGSGVQSEYVVLGDLAAGEEKAGRLILTGAPCAELELLKLTRAVCTVSPVADPPESCADLVTLDGAGVVEIAGE